MQYLKREIPCNINGIVTAVNEKSLTVLSKYGYIRLYTNDKYQLGDYLECKTIDKELNLGPFDYNDYLQNQNIYATRTVIKANVKGNYFVCRKIGEALYTTIKGPNELINSYIKTFLFGQNILDNEIKEATREIGISHILAVSGLHISILLMLLKAILDKLFYFERPKKIIMFVFLISYLFITNFSITVLRSVLAVLLATFFKDKSYNFSSLDILSISGILILLIHPRYLFLMSFQLSFLASFIIICFVSEYKIKNAIINSFFLTAVLFLASIPLVLRSNYEINLLTLLVSPLYSLIFEFILFPLTIIALIFPFLANYLAMTFIYFQKSVFYLSTIKDFVLVFGQPSSFFIIAYFSAFFLLMGAILGKKKIFKRALILGLIIFLLYEKNLFNPFYEIKFLNVGQGDAILIRAPYDSDSYLIDAFGPAPSYLKYYGVKHLSGFFVTHGHYDHLGEYSEVILSFRPKKLFTSYYDDTLLLNEAKLKYPFTLLKAGALIKKGGITFKVLAPKFYSENENNNSLVMLLEIYDKKILLAADMELDEEKSIIDDLDEVTIYKAAHHGSNSSSSNALLEKINPLYTVISVGKNNKYHLPNNKELLMKPNLYRTDYHHTISFIISKNYFKIICGVKKE